MEGAESGSRSSGILSIMNREHIERINTDTRYIQSNPMAAPPTASPASAHYSNGAPYSAGWPSTSHGGLISPPESRRTSNDKAHPHPLQTNTHRQSLPSIQEALSNTATKPGPYASPVSASAPPSHPQNSYAQSQALPPPRTHEQVGGFQSSQSRQPSPPMPIQPPPFSRPELDSRSFAEPRRPSSLLHPSIPQSLPANSYAAPRYEASRYEQEPRASERFVERPANDYGQPSPLHNQHPYGNAPAQPFHPSHPPPHGQGYPQPPYPPRDERDLGGAGYKNYKTQPEPFNQGLKRQLEVWDVDNNLAQINVSSTTLQDWSRHFHAISQEQPRSHITIPERSPDRKAIEEMLVHGNRVVSCLHRMLDTAVQQQHAADEQSRGARLATDYDDESMYGDDRNHQNFGGPDNKKRRGRAAPPGRCHSCNRAETPEWRRGPDGARTLCNACGLHYAKLTRKNTMKQSQGSTGSSLRPKSSEDHSPRS